MEGIIYNENFLDSHGELFEVLMKNTIWDESMLNRKTASYGKPYNYSQMQYQFQEFTREITEVIENIEELLGFRPNNCLINYYETGSSKMGYHSDQMDILEEGTGVVIISVGEARTLRFRNIKFYFGFFFCLSVAPKCSTFQVRMEKAFAMKVLL